MLKNEYGIRKFTRQLCSIAHLAGEQLDFKQEIMFSKMCKAAAPLRFVHHLRMRRKAILRIFVPVDLLPDAPRCRQLRQLFDQRADIGIRQVRVSDIGVRPTRVIRYRLNPPRFLVTFPCRPIRLNVYRFDDIAARGIGAKFLDCIVAANCFVSPEDARDLGSRQPRQILEPPDMMMTVYGGNILQLCFLEFCSRPETAGRKFSYVSLQQATPPSIRSRWPPQQYPDRRNRMRRPH